LGGKPGLNNGGIMLAAEMSRNQDEKNNERILAE
jgi:hypothetical protein